MATTCDRWTAEDVLAGFDEYLRRVRGVCAGTRGTYGRFAAAFLESVFAGEEVVDVARIGVDAVVGFVSDLTVRYRPRTVELGASALRSLLRFLRVAGLGADRLEGAVPMLPHRPSGLVRILNRDACSS